MENVTLNQKEQARLQILNSLLSEHMTVDQAATLMGVSTHTAGVGRRPTVRLPGGADLKDKVRRNFQQFQCVPATLLDQLPIAVERQQQVRYPEVTDVGWAVRIWKTPHVRRSDRQLSATPSQRDRISPDPSHCR